MCFLTHKAVGWECPVYCFFFYGIWFFFEGKMCIRDRADRNVNRQSFLMKGVVTDEDGESIIGATVMIGGTSKGTAVSYTHLKAL